MHAAKQFVQHGRRGIVSTFIEGVGRDADRIGRPRGLLVLPFGGDVGAFGRQIEVEKEGSLGSWRCTRHGGSARLPASPRGDSDLRRKLE